MIEAYIFKNAKHSIHNNLTLKVTKSNSTITNTIGITKVPETIFQIRDNIQVITAPVICGILS